VLILIRRHKCADRFESTLFTHAKSLQSKGLIWHYHTSYTNRVVNFLRYKPALTLSIFWHLKWIGEIGEKLYIYFKSQDPVLDIKWNHFSCCMWWMSNVSYVDPTSVLQLNLSTICIFILLQLKTWPVSSLLHGLCCYPSANNVDPDHPEHSSCLIRIYTVCFLIHKVISDQ
jgi:hypothetical protein